MNAKKHILGFSILLVLAVTILTSCKEINMHSEKTSFDFSELIKNENIDDVRLTIYYVIPNFLARYPWSIDHLINSSSDKKIVINGSELEEHLDLFNQINKDVFVPVKNKSSYLDARMYYVLESKKNGKLFDVAMWGGDSKGNSIFVNEHEVQGHDIFYDVVMPYLPEDAVKEFEKWKNSGQDVVESNP